jgi:hypothetical protein
VKQFPWRHNATHDREFATTALQMPQYVQHPDNLDFTKTASATVSFQEI